jgi:hypothetical protein
MLVRFPYDYRVAPFPSRRTVRASYAIFSRYVDAETNFYLKRRTLFGDRRFSYPYAAQIPPRFCLTALLFARVADVLLIYSSRPSPNTRSETSVVSFTSKSTVRSSSGWFAVSCPNRAKYASNTEVCRGLSQAENVARVRDFTGADFAPLRSPLRRKEVLRIRRRTSFRRNARF